MVAEQTGELKDLKVEDVKVEQLQMDDYEAQPRKLGRRIDVIIGIMAVALSLFQLYTSWRGAFDVYIQRPIPLAFAFAILFAI